ncbi:hypothetical protein [Sinimarinibacterium sp. NLF-5-8]|uniref:hypothetical protein n=1 Tax=Sinimarinibacterium sp. NLF-5-8 TaxID=2698684 RepID=UPI00137BF8C7|nr:hypothetical protein [Sinimarinibacterium sp. NLF-5-8]QHS10273.1 hypothetical protein GT972_09055 [Sinimarinibacterium sp. NLF-5-8]
MVSPATVGNPSPVLAGKLGEVVVEGGKQTNPLWVSQVSNEAFAQALQLSLQQAGYLSGAHNQYALRATLMALDKPLIGLNMTSTAQVSYVLRDAASDQVIFNEQIVASHTATVGDAFVAAKRVRLANEGAIRANIEKFIRRLGDVRW